MGVYFHSKPAFPDCTPVWSFTFRSTSTRKMSTLRPSCSRMILVQYRLNLPRSSREGSTKFYVMTPSAIRSITEGRTKGLWGAWCVVRADQRFRSLSVRKLLNFTMKLSSVTITNASLWFSTQKKSVQYDVPLCRGFFHEST